MYLIVQFLFKLQHQCIQESEANNDLVRALADVGIHERKSSLSIDHGYRSREKGVRLANCSKDVSKVLEILKSNIV